MDGAIVRALSSTAILEKVVTLEKWLKTKKLSGADLAEMLEVSQSAVSRWINGSRVPTIKYFQAIEKVTKGAVRPQDWYEN